MKAFPLSCLAFAGVIVFPVLAQAPGGCRVATVNGKAVPKSRSTSW